MKKTTERFRNWATTIIGIVIMAIAVILYTAGKFFDLQIDKLEAATMLVLGWVFFTAKDTLLEGLFLNLFRIKKEDIKNENND